MVFWCEFSADLLRGNVSGDAAASTNPSDRAEEVRGVPGVLFVAASGAEFVFDEPVVGSAGKAGGGGCGGDVVCSPALAQSSPRAPHLCRRSGDGLAVCDGEKYIGVDGGAGGIGRVGLVGLPASVASFDACGAGVLEFSDVAAISQQTQFYLLRKQSDALSS